MNLNHKLFFDGFKEHFDSSLEPEQIKGIDFLLDSFAADPLWKDIRHIAYALATVYHETAGSMEPVEEGYYLGRYGQARVKSFQKSLRYYPYFGRGYVQLTWKTNYQRAAREFGANLVNQPELALDPKTAFSVMTLGMFEGWFSKGNSLTAHIHGAICDYKGARRIINGTDKAALIAGYAQQFEKILHVSAATPTPAPVETQGELSPDPIIPQAGESDVPPTDIPKSPANKTDVVIEKEPEVAETKPTGFFGPLWQKVTAAITAAGGTDAAIEKAQQAKTFGLSDKTWEFIFYAIIAGIAIWIIYHFFVVKVLPWGKWLLGRIRTNQLVASNANADSTQVISADKLAEYAAAGYTVIRRS